MERSIRIQRQVDFPEAVFSVLVKKDGVSTKHSVTLREAYYQELTRGGVLPETLLRASFDFLLERESQDVILNLFDLSVIQKYFPDFETTIQKTLHV